MNIIITRTLVSLFALFILTFCTEIIEDVGVNTPGVLNIVPVEGTAEPAESLKLLINGIYEAYNPQLGTTQYAAVRWNGKILNLFMERNNTTYALKGGIRNDSLIFSGFSTDGKRRVILGAEFKSSGEMNSSLKNGKQVFNISLVSKGGKSFDRIILTFKKKLSIDLNSFTIFAHASGGPEGGYSYNSLSGIKFAALTGANGIEFDLNVSKDKIPFIFHDESFDRENVQSDFLVGPVDRYNIEDIKLLGYLPDGTRIPTLDEALNSVLINTTINSIWLDVKNPASLAPSFPVIEKYIAKAQTEGRILNIYIGIPDNGVLNEYKTLAPAGRHKVLTELSTAVVNELNADAWGPQFNGDYYSAESISIVKGEGKKVFLWTIDDPEFFKTNTGSLCPDGIITNASQKMIYEYLIQNK